MIIEELIGLILMVLNGWAAVIYWKINGVPFWQATVILTIYWSFTLFFTYEGTGILILCSKKIVRFLKKWEPFKVLLEKISEKAEINKRLNWVKEKRKKIVNWLIKRSGLVVSILTFVPLVPELPTATIIAAGIIRMKGALIILLLGNAFRVFVLCYTAYWIGSIF